MPPRQVATGAPTSHETTCSLTPRSQACPPSEALSPPSGGTQHGWSLSTTRVSLHVRLFLDLAVLGPGIRSGQVFGEPCLAGVLAPV